MDEPGVEMHFELIKQELSAIDGGVRSVDTAVFQVRNWSVTVAVASAGAAFAANSWPLAVIGMVATMLFWIVDAHYKTVQRVMIQCRRRIEDRINTQGLVASIDAVPVPLLQTALLDGVDFAFGNRANKPEKPSTATLWAGHIAELVKEGLLPHTLLLYSLMLACQIIVLVAVLLS